MHPHHRADDQATAKRNGNPIERDTQERKRTRTATRLKAPSDRTTRH
jgi:hypothetical protein